MNTSPLPLPPLVSSVGLQVEVALAGQEAARRSKTAAGEGWYAIVTSFLHTSKQPSLKHHAEAEVCVGACGRVFAFASNPTHFSQPYRAHQTSDCPLQMPSVIAAVHSAVSQLRELGESQGNAATVLNTASRFTGSMSRLLVAENRRLVYEGE